MNQAYYNGDFYQCVTATSAGESPTTAAAKWRKVTLPSKWRWALAQLTYAHLLSLDGQTDKAQVARSVAYGRDRVGLDELVRQEAGEEHHEQCHRGASARVGTGRTRPVAASVILDDAYRLIGWDADELDAREKADARAALSMAVQEVWEAWWWQELMTCARMSFAASHGGVETGTGATWYWPQTDWYYLKIGDPLITGAPTDASGTVVLLDAWAEWDEQSNPENWVATTTYNFGDQVSWDGVNYQCSVSTSLGSTPTDVSDEWAVVQSWLPTLPYVDADFSTTVGPFGPVRSVSKFDPRTSANPQEFELDVTGDGTRVIGLTVGKPWVWARRVTPVLTGDEFSTTATYEATDPQDLVYDA